MEKTPDSEQPQPPTAALPQLDAVPETREPTIHLDQFLKTCGVPTGGQAKRLIQGGEVIVNGELETRRRRQLRVNDEVELDGVVYVVTLS
ncbi:MAG: RNA-binding S4 domain-containing protein [Pirellulales bacterium]|jgi:ribosome-associated protein